MEVWKEVFDGKYQVSNKGRVKSMNYKCTGKVRILKMTKDHKGYNRLTMRVNGKPKTIKAHRLVAQAFIPNPENKPQVNHMDGNKTNNLVQNLEWVTNYENAQHALKTGLYIPTNSGKKYEEVSQARAIIMIDLEGNFIKEYGCIKRAADENNIWQSNICRCLTGKRKTSGGYKWEYVK